MNTNNTKKKLNLIICTDFPEIPADVVNAVLQLKQSGAPTPGAVIFFHLFLNAGPAHPVRLHALLLLFNLKYISEM